MSYTLQPITPGEILLKEFIIPLKMSQAELAEAISVPSEEINMILNNKKEINTDIALRLGRYFNMDPEFWLNLQTRYNLKLAYNESWIDIENEIAPCESDPYEAVLAD